MLLTAIAVGATMLLSTPAHAADPLTITVIVVNADVDGVAVTFTAAGLKRGDEVDVVTLTYTGVDNGYGPSNEPPSAVGKYRVQPSAAVFAKGSAANYDITYVGATFSIVIPQKTPLPTVEVETKDPPKKPTPRATPTPTQQQATPTATATPSPQASESTATEPTSEEAVTATPAVTLPATSSGSEESAAIPVPYSLAANAEPIVNSQVALYTLLAAAGAAAHRQVRRRREEDDSDDDDTRGELSGVKAGSLASARDTEGWGDRSRTWKLPFTQAVDAAFKALAIRLGAFAPLVARGALDGGYLRAMFGAGVVLLYPLSGWLAVSALGSNAESAIVPATSLLIALALVGMLDAAIGLLASAIYLIGLLIGGHLDALHDWLGVLGVALIWFAPPLLASAIRPLRRNVDSMAAAWERGTDYLITMLLTYWAITSMITALPALANQTLALADSADRIGLLLAGAIGVRMALEDLAYYAYPKRLRAQTVNAPRPTRGSQLTGYVLRTAMFAIVAFPFTGVSVMLWLSTAMFAFPFVLQMAEGKLPRFYVLARLLPRATGRIVLMAIVGTLFAAWVRQYFADPASWAAWSFVVLGIPGLVLSVLDALSDKPEPRQWSRSGLGVIAYRVGGVLMFVLLWQVQRGVNLIDWLFT